MRDLLKDKGHGEEAEHFRREDEKLIAKIRERAKLQEVAKALADKLRIEDAELLRRVTALGLDHETGAAVLLAPLVQVAWAEGRVDDAERKAVVEVAAARGITEGTPAHAKLVEWLRTRPSDELFETAAEVMRIGFSALSAEERDERIKSVVEACRKVAAASGGGLGRLLGIGDSVSGHESEVLDAISNKLRSERSR